MVRTRKLLPAKAGKRLRSLEYGNEMGVFIRFRLCTVSVVNIGLGSPFTTFRAYRSLLSTASVRRGGIPSRWEGPVSSYLPKQVRDCGAWNMEMKWGSLLKSGSGLRPPRRNRATAPGLTCSASGSLIRARHRVRPLRSPFTTFRAYQSLLSTASVRRGGIPSRWEGPVSSYLPKQVRDCGAWNMEMKWGSLLKSGSGLRPPRRNRATAPGPICSASGSLIRALHRVRRGAFPSLRRGLTTPLSRPRPPRRSPFTMGRTRKLLPAKAGKRLRSLEYGNEIEVFIKIGLRTASAAAESRHRARPDLQRFRVPYSGSAPRLS